jgi:hypothetical protein
MLAATSGIAQYDSIKFEENHQFDNKKIKPCDGAKFRNRTSVGHKSEIRRPFELNVGSNVAGGEFPPKPDVVTNGSCCAENRQ